MLSMASEMLEIMSGLGLCAGWEVSVDVRCLVYASYRGLERAGAEFCKIEVSVEGAGVLDIVVWGELGSVIGTEVGWSGLEVGKAKGRGLLEPASGMIR